MIEFLDLAGYVLAVATVLILAVTLAGPLVRHRMLVMRLRRDLRTIDATVVAWARDSRNR